MTSLDRACINTQSTVIQLQEWAEIYKGVIQDVISQVKEAFLDENVDIDVLSQLKKVIYYIDENQGVMS
ncbi:hypothetical protein NECAME_00336 [Necator americanus]|uniref:Uncharacterized protein n=1 Tax=Necator americanus TaxID=51031 RepID=W2TAT0_NECAM|nr:hypothetical protein NECAME_00336 [Necator americanus]ETN78963.1 hypothetical protein NECAME_00336 [Necator americanus]